MSTTVDLYGTARVLPTTGEINWGAVVTTILVDLANGANGISSLLSGVALFQLLSASTAVADGGTLTQTHPVHVVTGNGGAATLSLVTPIAAPVSNSLLVLIGNDNTNTITIENGGTTQQNGQVKLYAGDVIVYIYNSTVAKWCEVARSS